MLESERESCCIRCKKYVQVNVRKFSHAKRAEIIVRDGKWKINDFFLFLVTKKYSILTHLFRFYESNETQQKVMQQCTFACERFLPGNANLYFFLLSLQMVADLKRTIFFRGIA